MDLERLDEALTGQDLTGTDVAAAVGVLVLGLLLAIVLGRATRAAIGRPGRQSEQVAKLVARLVRWLVYVVAVSWALSILGVGVGWLTTTVAVVFVGVVLATKPLVENLAASAALVARPAFGVGDEVELDGHRGEVIEITGRSTVLRLRDGRRLHVPNAEVVRQSVLVFSTEQPRRSELEVVVAADADLDRAVEVLVAAARQAEAVVDEPAPYVRARELGDGTRLSLRFWHASAIREGNLALDQVVRRLHVALPAAGVVLAAPQVEVLGGPAATGSPSLER